uniref:Beta-defensin n=1 Tax=Pygocentrus nattereri TaxID=42514 RepID=A0AAR2IZP7_PYGNA
MKINKTCHCLNLCMQAYESGSVEAAVVFPWGCTNYSGVCRPMCLPTELPFGPFGCAKGFVCCVSHIIL